MFVAFAASALTSLTVLFLNKSFEYHSQDLYSQISGLFLVISICLGMFIFRKTTILRRDVTVLKSLECYISYENPIQEKAS